jgi:AI-2 transport protein TqsA
MSPNSSKAVSLQTLSQASLVFLAAIAGTVALSLAKNVLLPLVFALFLFVLILPFVNFMTRKWKMPKIVALAVAGVVYGLFGFVGVSFSVASVRSFAKDWGTYSQRFIEASQELQALALSLGFDFVNTDWMQYLSGSKVWDVGRLLTGNIIDWVSLWGLVSIYLLFLFMGQTRAQKIPDLIHKIQKSLTKYVWVKGGLALLTSVLVGIVLWSVGAELVFLFALLAFILNFIPSLGSIVATILPLPVLWLQFGFGGEFVVALSLMIAIQVSIGNVLEPKLMGQSLNIHPVTVMFFLVFWGFIWGVSGAFLSVPLTVILQAILSKIEAVRPIAALMAGSISDFSSENSA